MPAIKITPQRIEAYARVLQIARARQTLSKEAVKQLHAGFVARTSDGVSWTVGLKTGKWNTVREGRWVAGEPPAELYVDSDVLFELERVKNIVERDTSVATPESRERAPAPDAQAARDEMSERGVAPPGEPAAASPPPPRLAPERIVERPSDTEWSPVALCLVLGGTLAAIGYAKSNPMAYGAAALFALLVVSILVLHSQPRRH